MPSTPCLMVLIDAGPPPWEAKKSRIAFLSSPCGRRLRDSTRCVMTAAKIGRRYCVDFIINSSAAASSGGGVLGGDASGRP